MFRKKWFWIIVIILALAGGGYGAYVTWFAPDEAAETETVMETATVTVGDLSIRGGGTVGRPAPTL